MKERIDAHIGLINNGQDDEVGGFSTNIQSKVFMGLDEFDPKEDIAEGYKNIGKGHGQNQIFGLILNLFLYEAVQKAHIDNIIH